MVKTLIFFYYLLKTSIRSSISKRGAFMIESGMMIANNLIFFALWMLFFNQFNDIGGWKINDMLILMTIGTGAYGLKCVCFGGFKLLSQMITSGDLDPFMTQPKNLLLHIGGSRSQSKGWGNMMTALVLMIYGEPFTMMHVPLVVTGVICGALVFAAIDIIANCLPFWFGSVESISKKYCEALFLFALYPTNIYSGVLQVLMFTLIPAGIIGYLPVELVKEFSLMKLLVLVGSTAIFVVAAFFVFYCGLRRYESGNRFGIRM